MNFKINKREFLTALNIQSKAISSTTPLPSLSGIKLVGENNTLTLISSDSNISIKTVIKNEPEKEEVIYITEEGSIVIEARYILEIVRKIDSQFINVEIFDNSLAKIYGGNSEFKINTLNPEDYPNINFEIYSNTFKFPVYDFKKIVNSTAFACSDKDTRPILTGVNFKSENGKIHVNATDSYRLASCILPLEENVEFNITIPRKYLLEVEHSIPEDGEIEIGIDNQKVSFIFDNTIIQTRLLDDEFPDVSRLIPSSFTQKLVINSEELKSVVDKTNFIKADGKNVVKLTINEKEVDVTASGQGGAAFHEPVSVISFEGSPLEVSCSGRYLIDALKAISGKNVTISFSGELKPLIITDDNDDTVVELISPVRTYK